MKISNPYAGLIVILYAFSFSVKAQQNLVPNPGFENEINRENDSPEKKNKHVSIKKNFAGDTVTNNWIQVTDGHPDFRPRNLSEKRKEYIYTTDGIKKFHENLHTENAHSGEGQVGMNVFNTPADFEKFNTCPSYIQTKLLHPLEAGKSYHVEFYTRLENWTGRKARNLGALFTKDNLLSQCKKQHNLTLLVDVSQSMYSHKYIERMKSELETYLVLNGSESTITLITFGLNVKVRIKKQVVENIASIDALLGTFEKERATNVESAIIKGYGLIEEDLEKNKDETNDVVVLTDGEFNLFNDSKSMIRKGILNSQIGFTVYEFGDYRNEELIKVLDQYGGVYIREKEMELQELLVKKKKSCDVCELTQKPQFICSDAMLLNNEDEWVKISGCFIAAGGEEYMTVGSFYYCGSCPVEDRRHREVTEDLSEKAYYYFDDFKLTEDSTCFKRTKIENAKPDNVTILVDISTSMYKGKHMKELKAQLEHYISEIGKTKKITLITYGTDTKVLIENQFIRDINQFHNILNTFDSSAATNIAKAMRKAYEMSQNQYNKKAQNQVVLFTDAKFVMDAATEEVVERGNRIYQIELGVFYFGNYHNAELEKTVQLYGGQYTTSKTETPVGLLTKMSEPKIKNCRCDTN